MTQICHTAACLKRFQVTVRLGRPVARVIETLKEIEPDGAVRRKALAALSSAMSQHSRGPQRVAFPAVYVHEWFKQHRNPRVAIQVLDHAIEIARWTHIGSDE